MTTNNHDATLVILEKLSDNELHVKTKSIAKQEQALTLQLFYHLHIVDLRKSYAKLAYSSLWDYVVKELGYSESLASQKIQAMRLMFSVKEAKEKMESGELQFTTAAMVQRFLRKEEKEQGRLYAPQEKTNLVLEVSGKSKREVEKILLAKSPLSAKPKDQIRQLDAQIAEVKFTANESFIKKLARLKELKGTLQTAALLEKAMDFYLEKNDPLRKTAKQSLEKSTAHFEAQNDEPQNMVKNNNEQNPASHLSADLLIDSKKYKTPAQAAPLMLPVKDKVSPKEHSRYISQKVKLITTQRANGQCEYINKKTGKRCEGRFRLQYEHKTPWAMSGDNSLANIEMLCHAHNSLRAREKYGNHFIEKKIKEKKL